MNRTLYRFLGNFQILLGLALVVYMIYIAIAAPTISPPDDPGNPAPFRVVEGYLDPMPVPPNDYLPLGTVSFYSNVEGQITLLHYDVFHSLVWGARSALRFGLITALTAASLGILVGAVGAYFSGVANMLTLRLTDMFLAFPVIAAVWLFRMAMDYTGITLIDMENFAPVPIPQTTFQRLLLGSGLNPVMLAFILFSWMPYARMINANVTRLKQAEFVVAARVIGAKDLRIILRHLLPNAIAPAIVLLARDIGALVVLEASFAFIGVSGTVKSAAMPEWSRILLLSRSWIIGLGGNPLTYWWTYLPVTLALIILGLGWNALGDGLNTLLNPRETG
ncbi:MAG: ABC transporter permease [Anaerolineales bacterium]|nr:ABC transporter permease [Anaerolineales bacterium]